MVHSVEGLKKLRVMHKPVGPVKIGIMNGQGKKNTKNKINPTVIAYVVIKHCIALNGSAKQNNNVRRKKEKSKE